MKTVTIIHQSALTEDLREWVLAHSAAGVPKGLETLHEFIRVVGISRELAQQYVTDQYDNGVSFPVLYAERETDEETADYVERMEPLITAAFEAMRNGSLGALWLTESDFQLLAKQPAYIAKLAETPE